MADAALKMEWHMKQILVASDGSRGAERAVKFAAELACAVGGKLNILTVIAGGVSADLKRFGRIENVATGELLEEEAKATLAAARIFAENLADNFSDMPSRLLHLGCSTSALLQISTGGGVCNG